MVGYSSDKIGVVGRLRWIEGQIRGIQKMVEEDRYCIDVVTQLNAARAAPESVALLLLQEHTKHCVAEAITAGDPGPKVGELSEAIERMVRS
jgi:DNA-binding FrmR family transcriptional regulator